MSLFALVTPGGSPGCTTTALAITLTWPRPVTLAECDPAGGDILAGLFAGHLAAPRGLLGVAFEAGRGTDAMSAEANAQLAALDSQGRRMFLAGLSDPRQAPGVAPAWPAIARMLAGQPHAVIADCGRLDAGDGRPTAILTEAALVAMVMRSSLRQVAAAKPRIEMLNQLLGATDRLGLLLIGDQTRGSAEITRTLGVPLLASLPFDAKTAAVLSDGAGRRTNLAGRPLMRAAHAAGAAITKAAADVHARDLAGVNGHAG
jgi:hypothetical protein